MKTFEYVSPKDLVTRCIPASVIMSFWEEIEPFVIRGLAEAHHEYGADFVQACLVKGQMVAFTTHRDEALEMVCITEFCEYPNYKVLHVNLICGKNLFEASAKCREALIQYALSLGAVEIRAYCKDSQLRLYRKLKLGFAKLYNVISIDLRGRLQ